MDVSMKVNNHYFEQGNIQVNLSKSFKDHKLKSADGAGIVAAIENIETDY